MDFELLLTKRVQASHWLKSPALAPRFRKMDTTDARRTGSLLDSPRVPIRSDARIIGARKVFYAHFGGD